VAIDASKKKAAWVARLVSDGIAAADAIIRANDTAQAYSINAFNGGDSQNRPEYAITDADLVAAGFGHLNAAKLNSFIGGLAALKAAYDANAGIIEAARP
jgi:hypothetical protein